MNPDAGCLDLEAAPVIPVVVTIVAIVAVAIEALVHDLVAVAFLEAAGAADIVAADLPAYARDRLHEPQLV